jgi:hypothetical protein
VIYTDGTPTVASGDALPPSVARIAAARQRGEVRAGMYVAGVKAAAAGYGRDFIDHDDYRRGWDRMSARLDAVAAGAA